MKPLDNRQAVTDARSMAGRLALLVAWVAAALSVFAGRAAALPPCSYNCQPAGTWYWNGSSAQYALDITGIEVDGNHYEVSFAVCYGLGPHIWGSKGPEFQRFHCRAQLTGSIPAYLNPSYPLTVYVRGKYAWTWGA